MAIDNVNIATPDGGGLQSLRALVARGFAGLRGGNERSQAGRAAIAAFAIRVASAGVAYLSQVLLARWMGSFEYGVFVFVWVWVLILGGLSTLGLSIVLIRYVPEYLEREEFGRLRGLLGASRWTGIAVATVVAGAGLLAIRLLGASLDNHYVLPLFLAMFCLPLYTLTDLHDGLGRATGWITIALLPPYVLRPLIIIIVMVIARLAALPLDATTAAGAAVIATWTTAVAQFVLMQRKLGKVVPKGPRSYVPREWAATATPIFLIYAFELVLQNTDVLVLSHFMQPSDAGIYFAALKTISLIAFVHYAVGSAVAGRLSALKARGDQAALDDMIRDAANWTFWPSLFGGVVLLSVGKLLLGFFGDGFESGYPVMFVLVVGLLIRAAVGPAEFVFRMLGAQRACAVILGASALINIALNIILVPIYGIMGSAVATATAIAVSALVFYLVAKLRLGIDIAVWQGIGRRQSVAPRAAE